MSSKVTLRRMIATTFIVALSLAPAANASMLSESGDGPAPATAESFLGQAWGWFSEVWTDLTGMFAFSTFEDGAAAGTSSTTNSCSDSGWVIDPNGCPNG